jgi:hypothetical protein
MLTGQSVRRYTKAAAMRVYLPLTLPALAEVHRTGEVPDAVAAAFAVTGGLREWCGTDDVEELEYAALGAAAAASLRLLAAEPGAPRRRVVLAVDVPDGLVAAGHDDAEPGAVRVAGPVALDGAAAVHLDAPDAAHDVAAAARALDAADHGDEAAGAAVDGAGDHDLLWYATQEIPGLLE